MKVHKVRPRISTKLALAALAFFAPVAVMTAFIVSGLQETIDFARLELKGLDFERPLGQALGALGPLDSPVSGSRRAAFVAAIDNAFERLDSLRGEYPDLALDEEGAKKHGEGYVPIAKLGSE